MELKAAFTAGSKQVEYSYNIITGTHRVGTSYGCIDTQVVRESESVGQAISWLAPFRTTFDEADPAQMLIRYLSK